MKGTYSLSLRTISCQPGQARRHGLQAQSETESHPR